MVGVDPLEVDPQRVVVRVEDARGRLVDDRVAGAEHAEPPVDVLPEVDGGERDLPPDALPDAGVDVVERDDGQLLERRGGFERGEVGDPLHAARRPGGRPALEAPALVGVGDVADHLAPVGSRRLGRRFERLDQVAEPVGAERQGILGEECDELALGRGDRLVARQAVVERTLPVEEPDAELAAGAPRGVGRARVDADHLERPVELLAVDRLQAGAERGAAVQGRDDDRDRRHARGPHSSRPHSSR